jgi:hypothetical protein
MGWTRPLTRIDRILLILVGTVAGLGLLGVAVFHKVPLASELRKVSGRLLSYSFHTSGRHGFEVLLTIEGAPHRYWTDALWRSEAAKMLSGAAQVSLYSDKEPTYRPIDGDAYKSYGLWIDGRPVRSLESALETETLFLHVVFPLMGVGFLGMAFLVGRGWRR